MQLLKERILKDGNCRTGECFESRQLSQSSNGYSPY